MNTKVIDANRRSEIWDKADSSRNEEAYLRDQVFELINALEHAYDDLARIRCDYQADKQRFHDRGRELEEVKEREKKLREVINEALKEYGVWNDKSAAADCMAMILAEVRSSLYPKEEQHEHLQK